MPVHCLLSHSAGLSKCHFDPFGELQICREDVGVVLKAPPAQVLSCKSFVLFLYIFRILPETELADTEPLPATAGTVSQVQDLGPEPQKLAEPALPNPLCPDPAHQQILMPLEKVREAFLGGKATLFLLRIQKAASSGLDVLFSTDAKSRECQPNMRRLEQGNETCNRLFYLLHYALDKEECKDEEGWDQ
jgi:hypothetical protein